MIRIGPRVPAGTNQRKLEAGHKSRPTIWPSNLSMQALTRSLSDRLETDPKPTTGSRRYRRLDRHAGWDRVDAMPEQPTRTRPEAVFSVSVPVACSPSSYGSNRSEHRPVCVSR